MISDLICFAIEEGIEDFKICKHVLVYNKTCLPRILVISLGYNTENEEANITLWIFFCSMVEK